MQRTLKRELKVLEIVKREAIGTSVCTRPNQPSGVCWCLSCERSLVAAARRMPGGRSAVRFGWRTRQRRLGGSIDGLPEGGRRPSNAFVVTAGSTWCRLGLIEASSRTFQRAVFGSGDVPPGGRRRWEQLAVPADRRAATAVLITSSLGMLTKWRQSTRLVTRTKESNGYASIRVANPRCAMKVRNSGGIRRKKAMHHRPLWRFFDRCEWEHAC